MKRFIISETPLNNLKIVERIPILDERGSLVRMFCSEELNNLGWNKPVRQINHTVSKKRGTVRGLHFQLQPYTEMKLVSCLRGEIWDIAVDLRKNSPTFLRWHAEVLSAKNCKALLIPEGFAHGFQALTDDCELLYLHSEPYVPHSESGIRYDDPALKIKLPIEISEFSEKDKSYNLIDTQFNGSLL
jgi:dTDP-4-dehydrorhamnose 3,5-epimerase